mmetsp:Transcript_144988/g.403861  ORF Transcript_144988/g.403861 Transcript_144988/m.403861 type:complete len:180 (-) Transcript_144988:125-664(-)
MFQCRMCSESPFALLFGQPQQKERAAAAIPRRQADQKRHSRRDEASFKPRQEEEIKALVKDWEQYAHPRAREFFTRSEMLAEVLTNLAKHIDMNEDPVLGPEDKCVYWYGEVNKDNQACIRMVKPGETAESVTFVNRVLAFIFATDDSFEQLMNLPKEPFKMCCGDQMCIHLSHISMAV